MSMMVEPMFAATTRLQTRRNCATSLALTRPTKKGRRRRPFVTDRRRRIDASLRTGERSAIVDYSVIYSE
jgi:hypothetical protein